MTYAELRDAALAYARGGHRVFPVHARDKHPLRPRPAPGDPELPLADWQDCDKGGFHAGVCDEDLVRIWWGVQYRGAGIGYSIPPDVFVLDDDSGESLEKLKVKAPELAEEVEACTSVVRTARGHHYYFRRPENHPPVHQTSAAVLRRLTADHIRRIFDIKGGGAGYSILPPSTDKAWEEGDLDTAPVASEELMRALETNVRPGTTSGRVSLKPSTYVGERTPLGAEKLPPGTPRHPILLSEAGAMRERGWEADAIAAGLLALNEQLFEDPKATHLVMALAHDVCERWAAGERPPAPSETPGLVPAPAPETPAEPETTALAAREPQPTHNTVQQDQPLSAAGLRTGLRGLGVALRLNIRSEEVELCRNGSATWLPLPGIESVRLAEEMAESYVESVSERYARQWRPPERLWKDWTRLIASDRSEDPWRTWLDELPPASGGLGLVPGRGVGREALLAALMTAVARAYSPGSPFPYLPVVMSGDTDRAHAWWRSLFDDGWCYHVGCDLRARASEQSDSLTGPVVADICGLGEPRTAGALKTILLSTTFTRVFRTERRRVPRRSVPVACADALPDGGFCVPVYANLTPLDADQRRVLWRCVLDRWRERGITRLDPVEVDAAAALVKSRAAGSVYEQVLTWAETATGRHTDLAVASKAGMLNKGEKRLAAEVSKDLHAAMEDAGWVKRALTVGGKHGFYWMRPGAA